MIGAKIIAKWAGHYKDVKNKNKYGPSTVKGWPSYSTDAEAIELLNALVGKGYEFSLSGVPNKKMIYDFRVFDDTSGIAIEIKPTIHEAIVAAVLQVIEKEGGE